MVDVVNCCTKTRLASDIGNIIQPNVIYHVARCPVRTDDLCIYLARYQMQIRLCRNKTVFRAEKINPVCMWSGVGGWSIYIDYIIYTYIELMIAMDDDDGARAVMYSSKRS